MTGVDVVDRRRMWPALVAAAVIAAGWAPAQSGDASSRAQTRTVAVSSAVPSEVATISLTPSMIAALDVPDAGPSPSPTPQLSPGPASASEPARANAAAPAARSSEPERPQRPKVAAVRPGTSGQKVQRLQRRLAGLGFAPGTVDGAYGSQTRKAVSAFQMIAELPRTGRADAKTMAALADYRPDVTVLAAGDKGGAVRRLQRRLAKGPFDPGPVDGSYGTKTVEAVWALEKMAGVPVDGNWGPLDERAMARFEAGKVGNAAKRHDRRWVEFDLSEQVMRVYDPGDASPVLVSHGSSGSGVPWSNGQYSGDSVTPVGAFAIERRIAGWRESSLDIGRLYNPLYFDGGTAFHGATSVPLYPASHGCVRLPMHIAEYLPDELPDGTPVHILR